MDELVEVYFTRHVEDFFPSIFRRDILKLCRLKIPNVAVPHALCSVAFFFLPTELLNNNRCIFEVNNALTG